MASFVMKVVVCVDVKFKEKYLDLVKVVAIAEIHGEIERER